jgi:trehalose/maltose hydrolase-like predicted phosphorylase
MADRLDGLSFSMQFRETPIELTLEGGELKVASRADGSSQPIKVGVGDVVQELGANESYSFSV